MGIIDFVDYVQSLTDLKVYPLTFPDGAVDESVVVKLEASNNGVGIAEANMQIITRAVHPQAAETIANNFIQHFDGNSRYSVGSYFVVLSSARNPYPLYIGTDELNRYRFSVNVSFKIDKG